MKKKYSIKKNEDIQKLLRTGRFYKGRYMIVYISRKPENEKKVAFLVGKKLGHAPFRNKTKRRMRVATRSIWNKIPDNVHIIIMARPMIDKVSVIEIEKELVYILKKMQVIN